MDSSRPRNSTHAAKARFVKSLPRSRRKSNIGAAAVDADHGSSLAYIGAELHNAVMELERIESYIVAAREALEGGINPAADEAFARRTVGDSLLKQIRTLQDVAARRRH